MGITETQLLIKYGIPLAVKLLDKDQDPSEVAHDVASAIDSIAITRDITQKIANAPDDKAANIVEMLFKVLTGGLDAVGGLFKAVFGVLDES